MKVKPINPVNPFFLMMLLSLFITQNVIAQKRYRDVQVNSIDAYLGGDIGVRLISANDIEDASALSNRDKLESYKFNYKFGLDYNHGIGRSLILRTGIRISNPGFSISKVEEIDFDDGINQVQKLADPIEGTRYRVKYNMIGIPVGLKYILSKGNCVPYFQVGLIPSFYLGTNVRQIDFEENSSSFSVNENNNSIVFVQNR